MLDLDIKIGIQKMSLSLCDERDIFHFSLYTYAAICPTIRKLTLISKFMTSQPGLQTAAIHILPNNSRNKANQAIKLSQLKFTSATKLFLALDV